MSTDLPQLYPVTLDLACPVHGVVATVTVSSLMAQRHWTEYHQSEHLLLCDKPLLALVPTASETAVAEEVTADRPRNVVLWVVGPDTAPEALEIEQSDGKAYPLCTFSQVYDATFLGWMLSEYARADGLDLRFSLTSKLDEL